MVIIITTDILPLPTPSCQHLTTTTTTIQEKWRVQVQIPVVKIWNKKSPSLIAPPSVWPYSGGEDGYVT